ncbi:MAG TPA: hypothetical protein EYN82_08505, partial [Candidatus Marinimicrobia bacterium]|nr:hypothetical protein [Candidatus Neomarinimicrobiota bacterium]
GAQDASEIRVVFTSGGGNEDTMPDETGGIYYEFDSTPVPSPEIITLEKNEIEHLRILSYNVLSDGLFNPGRQPRFERIIKALEPDIMGFQEAYDDNDIEALFEDWLPGVNWHVSSEWNGNYVVSRYPILYQGNHSWRSMGVLLDTEEDLGTPLFFINSHFSCCGANDDRQEQVDELMRFVRDLKNGLGPFTLEYGTPIVHVGDFNLVGYRQQLTTLTDGDIVDEASYGIDFLPDWDNSPLTDLFSRHTHIRMGYTWRKDGSSFNPGKLDYILYTDSVIEPEKHFVLNTLAIPETELLEYGLLAEDTNIASDHLPRVMDIAETITESSVPVPNLEGWNLVGLPVIVEEPYYLSVFPNATEGTLFSFTGTYTPVSDFILGVGNWLHFHEENETTITGTIVSEITISLSQGWNLISGASSSIDLNTVVDEDNLIVPGTVYAFEGNYVEAESLDPGHGYWIMSTGEGEITLSTTASMSRRVISVNPEKINTLSLGKQTLYFGATVLEKDVLSYSLPPKPPAPARDIRFSGNTKLCTTDECMIEVMNDGESLILECDLKNGEDWELVDESGNMFECSGVQVLDMRGDS